MSLVCHSLFVKICGQEINYLYKLNHSLGVFCHVLQKGCPLTVPAEVASILLQSRFSQYFDIGDKKKEDSVVSSALFSTFYLVVVIIVNKSTQRMHTSAKACNNK